MSTVLITGANGFVGSHMCDAFLGHGYTVYGLVRATSDLRFLRDSPVRLIYGDLTETDRICFPETVDVIVHAAALVDDKAALEDCRRHVLGITQNLAEEAIRRYPRLKKFVYVSSALTLGYCGDDISEDRPGHSALYVPYVRMKREAEEFLLALHRNRSFPVTILRPGDIYGPRDRTSCELMLQNIEKGVPLRLGRGHHKFALCAPINLCRATLAAVEKPETNGKAYSVVNAVAPTWQEFFSALQGGLGRPQRIYVPSSLMMAVATLIELSRRIFPGFRPQINYYRIRRTTSQTTFDMTKTFADLAYSSDEDYSGLFKATVDWYLHEKATRVAASPPREA